MQRSKQMKTLQIENSPIRIAACLHKDVWEVGMLRHIIVVAFVCFVCLLSDCCYTVELGRLNKVGRLPTNTFRFSFCLAPFVVKKR